MNEETKDMGEGETVINGADKKTEGGKEEESLEQVEEITDGDVRLLQNIKTYTRAPLFCHILSLIFDHQPGLNS